MPPSFMEHGKRRTAFCLSAALHHGIQAGHDAARKPLAIAPGMTRLPLDIARHCGSAGRVHQAEDGGKRLGAMRGNDRGEDRTFRSGQLGHNGDADNVLAFHKETSQRTGRSERERRDADRGEEGEGFMTAAPFAPSQPGLPSKAL